MAKHRVSFLVCMFLSLSVTLVESASADVGMIVAMQRRVGNCTPTIPA
jgi:hypothetical protein